MLDTKFKLEYQSKEKYSDALPVIIVAAGSSSRMKGVNKQLLEIGGMPVIAKTIAAFEQSPLISKIILVTKEDLILDMQEIVSRYNFLKVTDIVNGGSCRFLSVLNGFDRLSSEDKKVLIHDGARPFVDAEIIGNVVASLQNSPCAVCAVSVKDTIKTVDENNFVLNTPERSTLFAVQTPQGVDVELYKEVAKTIENPDFITDDASVMELGGYKVKIVSGSYKNIKITTPEDVKLAEILNLEE